MRKRELSQFRTLLLERRQELLDEAGRTRRRHGRDRARRSPIRPTAPRSKTTATCCSASATASASSSSKIDEAIGRIEDGSYGKCEECGGDIGIERLKARPVTTLCIDCKSLQETQERKLRIQ